MLKENPRTLPEICYISAFLGFFNEIFKLQLSISKSSQVCLFLCAKELKNIFLTNFYDSALTELAISVLCGQAMVQLRKKRGFTDQWRP